MLNGQIPGVGAARQSSYDAHQLQRPDDSRSPLNMMSPPGLSLSVQNAVSNSGAHSMNMIPGLAFGSPPSAGSPGQFTSHTFSTLPSGFQQAQSSHATPSKPPVLGPIISKPVMARSPAAAIVPTEELSEGEFEEEFEDLYEPRGEVADVASPTEKCHPAPPWKQDSTGSADDSSIYDHNTPRVDANGDSASPASHADEDSGTLSGTVHDSDLIAQSDTTRANSTAGKSVAVKDDRQRAIADAKKKAQEAILALWPLKVRYHNYLEEGFDATIMQTLFKELGLDMNNAKTSQNTARQSGSAQTIVKDTIGAGLNVQQNPKADAIAPTSSNPSVEKTSGAPILENGSQPPAKSAAEERKDKIARKLAAKSQKPPVMPAVASELAPSKSIPTTTAKPKTRAETNALLHQKLAALKKSQEKAAADRLAAQSATNTTTEEASPTVVVPQKDSKQSAVSVPVNSGIVGDTANIFAAPSEPSLAIAATSMANLSAPNETLRVSKRPVAADFDDATSYPPVNLKRTRTQDTLIIDVSDDEDVEMEIGSPIENTNIAPSGRDQAGKLFEGHLTATTPGTPMEQVISRASTAPVPEGGGKLHLLRGKIEEMRRKIAEAEAKKTGKTSVNTDSPRSRSPTVQDTGSRKLPKLAELKHSVGQEDQSRNGRVVSVELLLIESDLKAKQDKLKAVVAEAAKLELEIQSTLAHRSRLASEMESFSSEIGSNQPKGSYEPGQRPGTETPDDQTPSLKENHGQSVVRQSATESSRDCSGQLSTDHASRSVETQVIAGSSASKVMRGPSSLVDETIASVRSSPESAESPSSMDISADDGNDDADEDSDISMQADDDDDDDDVVEDDEDDSQSVDDSSASSSNASVSGRDASTPEKDSAVSLGRNLSGEQEEHTQYNTDDNSGGTVQEAPHLGHNAATDGVSQKTYTDEEETALESPQQIEALGQDDVNKEATHALHSRTQESLIQPQVTTHKSPVEEDVSSYHSPLEYFRAYRFHPRFFDEVPGGLKSLTYSSKIDIEQMLCPSESVGEECLDSSCEYQHFNKMVLSDADIITQLGSADMFSGETKTRFIAGLRKILQELKTNKVKDFDRITKAIVQYRTDFVADKSKVLPLDGVNI